MRVLLVMAVISVISACASPPCRGRLVPVNAPVSESVSAAAPIASPRQAAP